MNKIQQYVKEFRLSSLAVGNKTMVLVLTVIIFLLGIRSYQSIPKESFPEIKQPMIYINTMYPGNSPLDMENLVSRPIEKEIYNIKGLKVLNSTNIQDFSIIIAEFDVNVDVDEVLLDVKDAVDRVKKDLPQDLPADPDIFELDFSEFPVVNVNLFGNIVPDPDENFEILKETAEYLQDEFEKLTEVSEAEMKGVQEKEVEIALDPLRMEAMQIGFGDVAGAIANENLTMSGGDLLTDGIRRNIRMVGEYTNMEEIANTIVKHEDGNIVYLNEIGEVSFDYVERTSYARMNGQPVITLDVKKRSGENLIIGIQKVREIIAEATKIGKIPEGVDVILTNDQSIFTKDIVDSLENSIIFGVILVVLVLLFFLGLRNALFVGIAIPLSMLMGFVILGFLGVSMNMVVLFSLILALGMLVDNGIVVVENIYRLREEGLPLVRAAKEGVGEVAWPIIASTATTLAAFLPLLFWNSLMGSFMKYLPMTLIIVLASSLFVGLVINPVLTSIWLRLESEESKLKMRKFWRNVGLFIVFGMVFRLAFGAKTFGALLVVVGLIMMLNRYVLAPGTRRFQKTFLPRLERLYTRTVTFALKGWRPVMFFVGAIVLMIVSMMAYFGSGPKVEFFPEADPLYVNVFIEMPIGTDIEVTNDFALRVEKRINEVIIDDTAAIEAITVQVGEGTADPMEGPSMGSSPHKARITVSFYKFSERNGINTSKTMEKISKVKEEFTEGIITIGRDNNGPPVGKPINVEITGEDLEELIVLATDVKRYMEEASVPGVEELKYDIELGKPELALSVNRDATRRFGLSSGQVMDEIRTALFGKEVSKYKEGEEDYKIHIRLQDEYRYDLESLINKKVYFMNNMGKKLQIPISAVVDYEYTSSYGSVKRKDLEKSITIFSNVLPGYNSNEVVTQLKEALAQYDWPKENGWKFTGEQAEQEESSDFLGGAFLMAIFLIFLILVSQFNSVFVPVVILVTILFSTIGVFLGLTITNMNFVVMMMGIGIISLAGVVVNNAIVLVDYIRIIRRRRREELGLNEDERLSSEEVIASIIKAGEIRLRPVLLTAITTVLGLIPLATGFNINFFTLLSDLDPQIYMGGDNAAFWGPMAWTVIYGLIFATFLTLVMVPVMYLGVYRLNNFFRKLSKV